LSEAEAGALSASNELSERRGRLLPTWQELRADAFFVTALSNVRYLAGFTGSNAALLLTKDRALLFTDPRYATQAPAETDCEVKVVKGPLIREVLSWVKRLKLKALGIEQNRISYQEFQQLEIAQPKVKLKPASGLIEQQRMIKSANECETIRRSVMLNSAALEAALRHFRPSATELDLAAEIDYRMRRFGADGTAFDTIVASGVRTALPHAQPGKNRVQANQLLLIDMGARVAGYCSDMTRTFAVGKLGTKVRRMYKAVLESQLAAIDAVKAGVVASAVDRAARGVLRGYGLDDAFVHSTGHGLGLEIHEGPRVGRKDRTKLAPGMAITIEPGVYLEGVGGIRIEDTVVVTNNGCEILTPTPKHLLAL
jgi:Xaa-Pro aminopeptidase